MSAFLLKLIMMPIVIGGITKASRKWGNSIGGLIASLPWIAAPIVFFFVYEQGVDFTVHTLKGAMMGTIGVLAFIYAYMSACFSFKWYICLFFGYTAYVVSSYLFSFTESFFTLNEWYIITMLAVFLLLLIFPKLKKQESMPKSLRFELHLRMITATFFVILITYLASILGPTWSGILTPFPIVTAILAAFTHYTEGANATLTILKGFLTGFVGYGTFLFLQAVFLPIYPIWLSFLFAFSVNIVLNILMRRLVAQSRYF